MASDPKPSEDDRAHQSGRRSVLSVALAHLARLTIERPWTLLLAALASLVPALLLSSALGLKSSFIDLLSHDDPEVRDLDVVLAKTGGLAFSTIAVPANDLPRAKRFALTLQSELPKIPGVRLVEARTDVGFIEDEKLYYLSEQALHELADAAKTAIDHRIMAEADLLLLDAEAPPDPFERVRKEAAAQDVPVDEFVVGNDGQYLYVNVGLGGVVGELTQTLQIQDAVERTATDLAAREPGLELRFTGPVVNRREDARTMLDDLTRAGALGFVAVLVLVLVGTRRFRSLLLLGLPLFIGLSWTFAFAYLAVKNLNAVSGFLVSILSGLGIEYGIHLYKRYVEERLSGATPEIATLKTLESTGRALLAACIVNAAVFAVVAVAGFRGFMEFGLIASVGMLLTMLATLVCFPPLNLVLERRWPMKTEGVDPPRPLYFPAPVRWAVLVIVPIATVFSIRALAQGKVSFHTDWHKLGADTPASRFDAYVVQTLGESTSHALLYMEDPAQITEVRAAVDVVRTRRKNEHRRFNVVSVIGVQDLVPGDQEAKSADLARLAHQLGRVKPSRLKADEVEIFEHAKHLAEAKPFTLADVPITLRQRFATVDGHGSMAVIVSDALLEDSDRLIDWADQMRELRTELDARGVRCALASENAVAGRIFRIITESGVRILVATFGVLFVVLYLEFRRITHALAVLGSVAVGMALMAGGMALLRIELNFMNAAVLPIAVGVSLDNAMHIFHRFREDGPASIPTLWRTTGAAALLSSATNATGFAALFVARHGGLRSVAALSVLGIGATVFTTMVFFPFALDAVGRLRIRREERDGPP